MKYENHHVKSIREVYESILNDYRDINEEEMNNHIYKKKVNLQYINYYKK